jgi:hypothetical protein
MAAAPLVNLGPRQRSLRYILGLAMLIATIAVSVYLVQNVSNRYLRASVFAPYWFAWLCLFQASAGICVFHARAGTCNLDQRTKPVDDDELKGRLHTRATWILIKTTCTAALWTCLVLAISYWDNP